MQNPSLIVAHKCHKRFNYKTFIVGLIVGLFISCCMTLVSKAETNVIYDPQIKQYVIDTGDDFVQEIVPNPYQTIEISDKEFEELRWVVALEAGSGNFTDKKAVVETILNRCLSAHDWGQNNAGGPVHGVLSKKGQFATYRYIGSSKAWNKPSEMDDDAISEVLRMGLTVLPSYKYVYFDSKGGVNGRDHIKIKGGNTYGAER